MSSYPPEKVNGLIKLLCNLGFQLVNSGKHNYKFKHPSKISKIGQRPFIVLSTNVYKQYSLTIIKEIEKFGFTDDEIKKACKKKIY